MSLAVDLRRSPRWVVHAGSRGAPMTWPFATRTEAEGAYRMAVQSGQFTETLGRGGAAVTFVSLWKRTYVRDNAGMRRVVYVEETG